MDLGTIKKKLANKGTYKSLIEVAEDVRLVWSNCMAYNADGSDFYVLAQNLSEKFERVFRKLLQEHGGGVNASANGSHGNGEVSLEDKRTFAKSLYKLTKEELGKVLILLDDKCPAALMKNSAEDEVEMNVDKISIDIFHELVQFVNQCQANGKAGKAKAKPTGTNPNKPVTKKAKTG
jgi:Bromodomain/Bromodomain extra-terminal - transcription regulation